MSTNRTTSGYTSFGPPSSGTSDHSTMSTNRTTSGYTSFGPLFSGSFLRFSEYGSDVYTVVFSEEPAELFPYPRLYLLAIPPYFDRLPFVPWIIQMLNLLKAKISF